MKECAASNEAATSLVFLWQVLPRSSVPVWREFPGLPVESTESAPNSRANRSNRVTLPSTVCTAIASWYATPDTRAGDTQIR